MNISYYQNQVNRIEKDLIDLQKKIAAETKKEIDNSKKIDSVNRTINKNTSASSLSSKNRQIQTYQKAIFDSKKKVSDYQATMAKKSVDLGRKKIELLKAEEKENKKTQQNTLKLQRDLQMTIDQQKEQLDLLLNQNYSPNINSENKAESNIDKEFDFFISHASEDKDDFVRELAQALKAESLEVWYDEFELKIGDSLRKKIDIGLSRSKYGIVIVSQNFIRKNWTEYELNGMVAREMDGHKVILPIWHKISKNDVLKYSPTLADKLALNTSIHTIDEIVKALKELL